MSSTMIEDSKHILQTASAVDVSRRSYIGGRSTSFEIDQSLGPRGGSSPFPALRTGDSCPQSKEGSRAQSSVAAISCAFRSPSPQSVSLVSSLLILALSFFLFAGWPLKTLALTLFLGIVLSLVISTLYFLSDVSVSLKAVKVDIEPHL